jgi:hypothetical protein
MSREERQTELREKTDQLLKGSLKHVRAAALAAVLVPLASVAATRAVAEQCPSAGCPPPVTVPSPCDFTTSGGFVLKGSGKKLTFGAHGGCKHGEFWGNLNLIDHETGYSVNSLEILGYVSSVGTEATTRDICGTATTNGAEGQPVYFRLRLVDNGEPGLADQFGIRLSNGYHVSTRLLNGGQKGGGNVQLHEPNPSTTGPEPAPSLAEMCGPLETLEP